MKPLLRTTVAALMLTIAAGASAYAATPKDTLVMAYVIDDIITLDPAEIYEISSSEYQANAYDRLVALDPSDTSKILNKAAESWSVSPDGKTFIFKIRKGIKFQSGNTLTAEDAELAAHALRDFLMNFPLPP